MIKQSEQIYSSTGIVLNQQYIDAWLKFGTQIAKVPLIQFTLQKISKILPQNYEGIDLAAPNFHYVDQIVKNADKLGKIGKFIAVDPFPQDPRVLEYTAMEFLDKFPAEKVDLILIKSAIHLMKDLNNLFQKCYNKLKSNGVLVVHMLLRGTSLPWTEPLQRELDKLNFDLIPLIPKYFKVHSDVQKVQKSVEKETFIDFIKFRGWSNLLANTEEEIAECIKKLEKTQQSDIPMAKIKSATHYLTKAEAKEPK